MVVGAVDSSWVTRLSQLLVAFTIEVDDEFEQRMPHRTAATRAAGLAARGPWLASLAMWLNFLQYVPERGAAESGVGHSGASESGVGGPGISLAELRRASGLAKPELAGMVRWGYVTVGGDGTDASAVRAALAAGGVMRRTSAGSRAAVHWQDALAEVESRWSERYPSALLTGLHAALAGLTAAPLHPAGSVVMPAYLPNVGPGFWSTRGVVLNRPPSKATALAAPQPLPAAPPAPAPPLPTLLSRALLAFAFDFEQRSPVSLVLYADFLSAFAEGPVRASTLSLATGVTKTTARTACGFLERSGFISVGPDPATPRTKLYQLTPAGAEIMRRAAAAYRFSLERFAVDATFAALNSVVERMHALGPSPLAEAVTPHADGWRDTAPYAVHSSAVRADPFAHLPRFPFVTHRGGYPDGS